MTEEEIQKRIDDAVSDAVTKAVASALKGAKATKPPEPPPYVPPVRLHTARRRKTSDGGCDMCGFPVDDTRVHDGKPSIDVGPLDDDMAVHVNDVFTRHRDMTLCSDDDCTKHHVEDV